jgi:hypothetical protein
MIPHLAAASELLRRGLSRVIFACALGACLASAPPALAQGRALEYAVKATYLYKLAPFVDWPADAFASASSPFDLCIAGDDPFRDALDAAVSNQRIGERRIVVRRLAITDRPAGCHILFLGSENSRAAATALKAVAGAPVLTITDGAQEPDAKGVVNFVVRANRVRFEIDDLAAATNRLAISSKLLNLALNVRPRE